ncbi:terminase small subunit [Mycobacterium phage Weirdo19]|uniref:Terminase small subunit n=1 Tax=Mycobacterium phage Weirdo19 TaxID=2601610 RepID=A0A6M2YT53_9CAUD|nr:terminase small subunit [Mycobacterium phage Weirdo19]QEA10769.1 terminase small subunit [Mycobacterium phage Weirdo19]
MTPPAASAAASKSVAAQGKKAALRRSKSGARQGNSATPPRKTARKRWSPEAGARLRADLWRDTDPGGIKLLVEQACRVADRLETLDRTLRGDAGAMMSLDLGRILAQETPAGDRKAFYVELALKVDAAVSEERQQAKLFASLLSDIARQRALLPPSPPGANGSGEDDDLDLD